MKNNNNCIKKKLFRLYIAVECIFLHVFKNVSVCKNVSVRFVEEVHAQKY